MKAAVICLFVSLGLCVVAGAIYGMVNFEGSDLILELALICVAGISLAALQRWEIGIFGFFAWILLEDLFRKFNGNNMLLYFPKDVVYLCTIIGYVRVARFESFDRHLGPFPIPLLLLIGWGILRSVSSAIVNPKIPLIGMRMSFLYVPMLYLGFAFAGSDRLLRNFMKGCILSAAVVGVIGIAQLIIGIDFLNPSELPKHLRKIGEVRYTTQYGNVIRPTSVFVSDGRFAQYLFLMVYMGMGFLGFLHSNQIRTGTVPKILYWLCWTIVLAAIYVTGVKAVAGFLIISLPVWLLAHRNRDRVRILFASFVVVGAILAVAPILSPVSSVSRFYANELIPTSDYSDILVRPHDIVASIRKGYAEGGIFGFGTGTSSLGLQYLTDLDLSYLAKITGHSSAQSAVEGGYAAVLWEWGIIGLILWLWFAGWLSISCGLATRKLKGTSYYWIAFSITIFSILFLFPYFSMGMQVFQNYVVNSYLWFLFGVVLRLGRRAEDGGDAVCQERLLGTSPGLLPSPPPAYLRSVRRAPPHPG